MSLLQTKLITKKSIYK